MMTVCNIRQFNQVNFSCFGNFAVMSISGIMPHNCARINTEWFFVFYLWKKNYKKLKFEFEMHSKYQLRHTWHETPMRRPFMIFYQFSLWFGFLTHFERIIRQKYTFWCQNWNQETKSFLSYFRKWKNFYLDFVGPMSMYWCLMIEYHHIFYWNAFFGYSKFNWTWIVVDIWMNFYWLNSPHWSRCTHTTSSSPCFWPCRYLFDAWLLLNLSHFC